MAEPLPLRGMRIEPLGVADGDAQVLFQDEHSSSPEGGYGVARWAMPAGLMVLSKRSCQVGPVGSWGAGQVTAMLVPVMAGWRTEVYLDVVDDALTGERVLDWARATVLLGRVGEGGSVWRIESRATEIQRLRLMQGQAHADVPEGVLAMAARSPLLALHAAYASLQAHPQDVSEVQRCLHALPEQVRYEWPDARLLACWSGSRQGWATEHRMRKLSEDWWVPLHAAGWRWPAVEGRNAPPLTDLAVEAIGQWRLAGSLWTVWQQPEALFEAYMARWRAQPNGGKPAAAASAQPALCPAWDAATWRAVHKGLKHVNPEASPFQQALRRHVLDALADDTSEPWSTSVLMALAEPFGLTPALTAQATQSVYAWAARQVAM